ncbi:polymer-forming cytoskeletal protein [Haloarchaeobius sp. TZWWS8]|uniref:polymer-forming cytoskeletal protein n=1 Tax=Haloarchaeobius sp. TZWWS8 TaxID=3446121 RepID=UPI003EBC5C31
MRYTINRRECEASATERFESANDSFVSVTVPVRDERALSPVIAVSMLMLVVATGAVAILVGGQFVLADMQTTVDVDRAESSLTQLDAELEAVGAGDRDSSTVQLGQVAGEYYAVSDAGRLTITHYNYTGVGHDHVLYDATLGEVGYRNGDTTIALQGGGIWRSDGGSVVMLEAPDVRIRNGSLDVHVTRIQSADSATGSPTATVSEGTRSRVVPGPIPYPSGLVSANPVANGTIVLDVQSDYYLAWGRYFERTTARPVTYDHATKTVSVDFTTYARSVTKQVVTVVPPDPVPGKPVVLDAIVSPAAAGNKELSMSSGSTIDSFDSSIGPYRWSSSSHATVNYNGDVVLSGDAIVYGNVNSSGHVTVGRWNEVHGDVKYGSGHSVRGNVTGTMTADGTAPSVAPVDALVTTEVARIQTDNDNGLSAAIVADRLTCLVVCSLGSGEYYLSELTVGSNEKLVVDATRGNVTIAVDGDAFLASNAHVAVVGSHQVTIYTTGDSIAMASGARVTTPGNRGTQVWFMGMPGTTVALNGAATVAGVIYVPGTDANPSTITVSNSGAIYGALVGRVTEFNSDSHLHYDLALRGGIDGPSRPFDVTRDLVNYSLGAPADALKLVEFIQCTDRTVVVSLD